MFDNEWHFAGTHLQDRTRAAPACARIPKARIEEASVMDTKFADEGIKGHHFGRVVRRHLDGFLRGQDVELARIKNQGAIAPCSDRLPEFGDVIAGAAVHINKTGMTLGAVADEFVRAEADQIDPNWDAVGEVRSFGINEAFVPMERRKRFLSH